MEAQKSRPFNVLLLFIAIYHGCNKVAFSFRAFFRYRLVYGPVYFTLYGTRVQ